MFKTNSKNSKSKIKTQKRRIIQWNQNKMIMKNKMTLYKMQI